MLGWLKTLIVGGLVIGLVVFGGIIMTQQNSNTRVSMEVDGAIMTALLGEQRGQNKTSGISKKEFAAAVVTSIVDTQKNHGKTVEVDYVFLNSGGGVTSVEEEIRSVQYQIQIQDRKDPTQYQASAVKRLAINVMRE